MSADPLAPTRAALARQYRVRLTLEVRHGEAAAAKQGSVLAAAPADVLARATELLALLTPATLDGLHEAEAEP